METLGDKILPKFCSKYKCDFCDYFTSKKSSYVDHILSAKHQKQASGDVLGDAGDGDSAPGPTNAHNCPICNKRYKSRNGLWKHRKICKPQDEVGDHDLIMLLMKQNTELIKEHSDIKQLILEIVKNGTNNTVCTTNIHNNNNSHNKAFNLNFFLNETCKNAMNLTDFVESIKVQVSDLEIIGELGYIEGLSSIITTNLKALDETERPVHCTDKKRETIYIKDDNKWEKEDDKKTKLRKVIRNVANKNIRLLPQYREKYPGCQYADSKYSDKYNKMVIEAMGGKGNDDIEKEDKIIHNITKNIVIKK